MLTTGGRKAVILASLLAVVLLATAATTPTLLNLATEVKNVLSAAHGGTGLSSPGSSGNVLTSDGANWTSQAPSGGGGGGSWSALSNPSGALSLSMGTNKSTFTYGSGTSTNNLFNLIGDSADTGTGALFYAETGSSAVNFPAMFANTNTGSSTPALRLCNTSGCVTSTAMLDFYVNDIAGTGTARVDYNAAGQFKITNNGTTMFLLGAASGGNSNGVDRLFCNIDGLTGSDVCFSVNSSTSISFTSGSAILQVKNGSTAVFDVRAAGPVIRNNAHLLTESASNDTTGTIGLSSTTSASKTFTNAYANAPACVLTPTSDPTSTGNWWVTTSTTAVTAHVSSSGTITFAYVCVGNPN